MSAACSPTHCTVSCCASVLRNIKNTCLLLVACCLSFFFYHNDDNRGVVIVNRRVDNKSVVNNMDNNENNDVNNLVKELNQKINELKTKLENLSLTQAKKYALKKSLAMERSKLIREERRPISINNNGS